MKALLSLIISGALVVSGYAQTRNVLVGTNNAVVQPTNFWSADASNARTGLGLGSAATNPASAFQSSSATLSNLSLGNGSGLTNVTASAVSSALAISNTAGLQAALDGKLATNGSAASLTSFPASILQTNSSLALFPAGLLRTNGDGSGLTNLPVPAVASNVLSTIAIEKGGTGATNAAGARTALGATAVGANIFTAADAGAARSAIGLGTASTNPSSAFQPSSAVLSNLANNDGGSLTNITAANIGTVALASNITGTAPLATNVTGVVSVTNGGTGGTNEATARSGIGLGTTNTLTIAGVVAQNLTITAGGGITLQAALTNAGSFRTNIGLPWSGLTSVDAPAFRTALGLGTAATSAVTSLQPSSSVLTNLAANNGSSLTNLQASNLVGTINISNVPVVTLTNIDGTLAIAKGGTGATNASEARQNLGATTVGNAVFVATSAESARTAINALAPNGNAASLTNFPASLLRTNGDGLGITNISGANVVGTVASASNITGTIAISNVSNLQSSLDSKLGTNPTLTIANISNLQTSLDGKLGTNPTLQISNISALQTALDAKLTASFPLNISNISNLQSSLDGKLGTNPTLQISNIASLQTALDSKLSGTFPIAISNVSGLQTSLDGKLSTNPTLAIANITGLQTNLDSKLSLTGNAVNLTNFPASLLRTTGDASGLTNFPTLNQNTTGTASNVTGVVAIANGGTGTNSAIGARANLGLSWSGLTNATAETFRTALGLGSLSTLSAVAISNVTGLQAVLDVKLASNGNAVNLTNFPSSLLRTDGNAAFLTNFPANLLRTTGDASNLTNFPTFNQNTTGTAGNVTGVVAITNGGSGATTASGARAALGLGTAATNPASAFQPSSTILSNLSSSNGGGLTNIAASSVVGTVALASNITGTAALASNVTGIVAISNGGTGATNQSGARTALGVGSSDVFVGLTNLGSGGNLGFSSSQYILGSTNSTAPNNAVLALNAAGVRSVAGLTLAALTNTDNASFRAAVGLDSAATNPATAFQPSSPVLSNLTSSNAIDITNVRATNIVGTLAISNGGSGATTVGGARTNLGLVLTALTNTNLDSFRAGIGLGGADSVEFLDVNVEELKTVTNTIISLVNQELYDIGGQSIVGWNTNGLEFGSTAIASKTRTNLGLGASWLTNTNNPVFVNTNGEVVSPTNFWQAAPITTTFIESQPTTNSTTNITASRFLHIHSLATNIINTTNTIVLPTNGSTFEGDMAMIVHKGPTNSTTQIRQVGSTNNIITLGKFNEAVDLTFYNNAWQLLETVAFTDPIYFSGTNTAANAAASRTNLGLGATWLTNTNVTNFRAAVGLGEQNAPRFAAVLIGDTNISFESSTEDEGINFYFNRGTNASEPAITVGYQSNSILTFLPILFQSNSHAAATRTNLGIPLAALTNTTVTNFQKAIFYTNTAPSNIGGNLGTIAAWIEIVASNGVTYKIPAYTNVP